MDRKVIEQRRTLLKEEALFFYDKAKNELDDIEKGNPEFKKAIERGKENLDIGAYDIFEVCMSVLKRKGYDLKLPFCDQYIMKMQELKYIDRLKDSKKIKLCGDIIITDPCYIIKNIQDIPKRPKQPEYSMFGITDKEFLQYIYKGMTNDSIKAYRSKVEEWVKEYGTDWEKSNGGYNMEYLGFNDFLSRDTLCGDWSCHIFDTNSEEVLGEFCADSGMVCVCLMDEVFAYDPDCDFFKRNQETAAIVRDFDGEIQIAVKEYKGVYEEDWDCNKKGDPYIDYEVQIIGNGNINFVTKQTGF